MNKLHSVAFYALLAPAVTLSSVAVLAQQSGAHDVDREQPTTQSDQGATQSNPGAVQSTPGATNRDQGSQRTRQSDVPSVSDRQKHSDKSLSKNRGSISSVPANGWQANELIGTDIYTSNDEDVGSVDDLIIDEDGQVVAVVVGVGGFLGLGEKDVAIGWDRVTKSKTSDDDRKLRVDMTREELSSAPEFEQRD